jgi:hypothetical protein
MTDIAVSVPLLLMARVRRWFEAQAQAFGYSDGAAHLAARQVPGPDFAVFWPFEEARLRELTVEYGADSPGFHGAVLGTMLVAMAQSMRGDEVN